MQTPLKRLWLGLWFPMWNYEVLGLLPFYFPNKNSISSLFFPQEHEIEQFEDDPLEYLRLDLSIPVVSTGGSEGATRRHAAADVLRALVNADLESETTAVVLNIVSQDLQAYKSNPSEKWKQKDRAIFLISAIASRGSTLSVCKVLP